MRPCWQGSGPEYELEWGGRTWVLKVDGAVPGLTVRGAAVGPLLALEGVAAIGRSEPGALSGATLIGHERVAERVEATYAPVDWGGLTVRAAWVPVEGDAISLEVQVSARTVDELKGVEVKVASVLPEPAGTGSVRRWVEPRDARSAGLSYDGRERDIQGLTTLPPPDESSPLAPRVVPGPWPDAWSYIEVVHPDDAARRITEAAKRTSLGHTTRYGLFGHDLEKGVVLRARLRGVWTQSSTARQDALVLYERFLREPPPLGP